MDYSQCPTLIAADLANSVSDYYKGHKASIAFRASQRGYWWVVTLCSLRACVIDAGVRDGSSIILRNAPGGEYKITTKQLKELLKNEPRTPSKNF